MIATNLEQSKHLVKLGLDPKTADMFYPTDGSSFPEVCDNGDNMQADNPAWSLSALLEVMPKKHEPEIQKSPVTGQYFVYGFFDGEKPTYMTKDYDSPIDAAYEMVCWLLEQGLIKKGDNDESKS